MACSHKRKRSTCSILLIKTAQAWVRGALQNILKTAIYLIELKPSKRLGVLNFHKKKSCHFLVSSSREIMLLYPYGMLGC